MIIMIVNLKEVM